jgi:TolB protein
MAVIVAVLVATRDTGTKNEPADSPSGGASPSVAGADRLGVQVVNLDGSVVRTMPDVPTYADHFALSPDGTTIAYMDPYLSTMSVDGTNEQHLGDRTSADYNRGDAQNGVSWSPDGGRLVYAWDGDIYVIDADGGSVRQLTSNPNGDFNPSWSPDGSTIVYWNGSKAGMDGGPNNAEIYTIAASGGSPTQLTHDDVPDIEPAWSPDSSQIAYFHGGELWVMNADGTNQHRVYAIGGGAWSPAWSPDGKRIAFLRFHNNPTGSRPMMQVLVLDLATGKASFVPGVETATDNRGPVWVSNTELLIDRYPPGG